MSEENDIIKALTEQLREADKKNGELMQFVGFVASLQYGFTLEEYVDIAIIVRREAKRLYDKNVGDK